MKNIARLKDMIRAISAIQTYTPSSHDTFLNDQKAQDAIMFNLVILGEAANQVDKEFQERHPEIPWSSIIGTRNVIVHGYEQIRLPIVWDIIQNDLQDLQSNLKALIE